MRTCIGDLPVGRNVLQQLQHHRVGMDVAEDHRKTLRGNGSKGAVCDNHNSHIHQPHTHFQTEYQGLLCTTSVPEESLEKSW